MLEAVNVVEGDPQTFPVARGERLITFFLSFPDLRLDGVLVDAFHLVVDVHVDI